MKRILSLAIGLFFTSALLPLQAQDSQFAAESIPVESLGFNMELSPDDHTLVTYESYILLGDNETIPELLPIDLIDISTRETIGTLNGHTDWVTDVAFSSDGQQMVSFHRNGDLLLWDVANLSLIKTIQTYTLGGGWVSFLADGKTVVYRAGESIIATLDLETETITLFGPHFDSFDDLSENFLAYPGRGDIVFAALAASSDGKWLATSSQNDQVTLIDRESGEEWILREKSEQYARLAVRPLFFSPDDSQLVYFDQSTGQTHWWDVATRTEIRSVDFGGTAFAVSSDLTTIAWADRETSTVYIANTATPDEPTQVLTLPESLRVAPNITNLAFTSDGSQLIVGGLHARDEDNAIYIIDLSAQ